jgi:hypothetical protein
MRRSGVDRNQAVRNDQRRRITHEVTAPVIMHQNLMLITMKHRTPGAGHGAIQPGAGVPTRAEPDDLADCHITADQRPTSSESFGGSLARDDLRNPGRTQQI